MYRNYIFTVLACIILFGSCKSKKDKDLYVFKALNESLERATRMTNQSTDVITLSVKDKTRDPVSRTKAEMWYPKLQRIRNCCEEVNAYIDNIKLAIAKTAKFSSEDDFTRESNVEVVETVIVKHGHGKELHRRLKILKDSLLNIDTLIRMEFQNRLTLLPAPFNTLDQPDRFVHMLFNGQSAISAISVLSMLQNNLLKEENRLSVFCHENSIRHILNCTFDAALISQSSSCVKGGEEIKIQAGIGVFKTTGNPKVTIDGKQTSINEGVAVRKIKSPQTPGRYKVPVEIEFLDEDGIIQKINTNIFYSVMGN